MKFVDFKRRISDVMEGMETLRVKGTRIDWSCLRSRERALFENVW